MKDRKNIVYQEVQTFRDTITGETTSTHNRKLIKLERTPDFIMLFTERVGFLEDLQAGEKAVLSQILQHYVGVQNIIFLSSDTKKDMATALNVGLSSIQKATKSLLDKQIIIKGIIKENQIYLNPHLFGKGNWENIHKMRQEVIYDFDFEKKEMKESRRLSTQYEDDIEIEKHDVIETNEYSDEEGTLHQDITIQKKAEERETGQIGIQNLAKEGGDDDKKLIMLNADNENKKLAIEEMQLKIKMKELGII